MINTTNLTNINGSIVVGAVKEVNTLSGGVFGLMLVLAIYVIAFITMLPKWGVKIAFSTVAFIGFTLTLFLRLMEIVNDFVLYATLVIVVIAAIMLWMTRNVEL